MIADILTVVWKERKGLLRQRGSRTRAVLTMLIPVVMVAIYFPWSMGPDWFKDPIGVLLVSVIIPMLLVGITIPESFAGERERHTLETLLASRLSDRSILFGKVATSVAYAWVMTLLALLVSLVTVNIAHWDGHVMLFTPIIALADVTFSLIISILIAGLGVLISLRSATVQGAQQALISATLIPLMLLGMIALVITQMKPEWIDRIVEVIGAVGSMELMLIIGAVLVVISWVLLRAAMGRFKRARLILD
jgi:ABC-2 type transport system permease protein